MHMENCILFEKRPDKNNTEGLRSALARLRHRTGPSLPNNPSNGNSQDNEIIDPKTLYFHQDRTATPPNTPSTPRAKTKGPGNAMTVNGAPIRINNISSSNSQNQKIMALTKGQPTASSPSGNSSSSENDGSITAAINSTTSTALRRLYFKSGRSCRTKSASAVTSAAAATNVNVPKVVVMGTSTQSTATDINTSTESASTLITTVTATDTSETYDSLDMGDNSGLSEPLLSSLDEPHTSTSIGSDQDITEMELQTVYSRQDISLLEKLEEEESSLIVEADDETTHELPNTAPIPTSSVHFPFDPPSSPRSVRTVQKTDNLFTFQDASLYLEQQKKQKQKTKPIENCQKNFLNKPYSPLRKTSAGCTSKGFGVTGEIKKSIGQYSNDYRNDGKPHVKSSEIPKTSVHEFDRYEESNNIIENKKRASCKSNIKDEKNSDNTSSDDAKKQKKDFKSSVRKNSSTNMTRTPSPTTKDKFGSKPKPSSASALPTHTKERYYAAHYRHSDVYDSKNLTMFPFDREAIDLDRIQRECFAVDSSPEDTSESDTDDRAAIYGRKLSYQNGSNTFKTDNIFQQYTLLSQQEHNSYEKSNLYHYQKQQQQQQHNQKSQPQQRSRPDLIHNKKYEHLLLQPDAFSPKPLNTIDQQPKSTKDLNKFEQIATKFEQIQPSTTQNNLKLLNSDIFIHSHGSNTSLSKNLSSSQNNQISLKQSGSNGSMNGKLSPRGTPPLPDLRVDFCSESLKYNNEFNNENVFSSNTKLDDCQLSKSTTASSTTTIIAANTTSSTSINNNINNVNAINVTANPMEAAVCTQPRATIVVQQPSLSLDNTVETLLLKNEGDFIGVELNKESRKKKQREQREESMRQLLDVTNTFTIEELRDFEMRYGSPHHCRSQSVKTPGSRASGRPNQLCLPQQRNRVASMPNTGVEEEYYRLRHFSITGKGVVNRGDSLKSRRSRSNNSVASSNSSNEHLTTNSVIQQQPTVVGSTRTSATCSLASSRESSTSNPGNGPYKVLMLGGPSVGKSSLVSQFMTSEYLHAYDTSIDDESGEKSVSVLLSGEESELTFIDHSSTEISPENCLSSYEPHGYCVIYSSADRCSFNVAEMILQKLWTTENIAQKAVILVGNKADLARCRMITSDEGKAMATAYDCKFIETSVGINHNVDELLVGLLSQIRLKLENPEKSRDLFRKRSSRRSKRRACSPLGTACLSGNGNTNPSTPIGPPLNTIADNTPPGSAQSSPRKYRGSRTSASLKVKGLLGRVWARDSKSKSCENLHVL